MTITYSKSTGVVTLTTHFSTFVEEICGYPELQTWEEFKEKSRLAALEGITLKEVD